MSKRKISWLAWFCFSLVALIVVADTFVEIRQGLRENSAFLASSLFGALFSITTAFLAALIISRQPRNAVGWLLILSAIGYALATPVEFYLGRLPTAPSSPSAFILLTIWVNSWGWLLVFFPLILIPLLYPTGKPPTPGWRWILYYAYGFIGLYLFFTTFQTTLAPVNFDWTVSNPIGFIGFNFPLTLGIIALIGLILFCVLSLFVRYRRAEALERAQIRWFMLACALFGVIYTPLLIFYDWSNPAPTLINVLAQVLILLALLALPISIAIAILRYRLWDIDVIIRRTLVYGALTATLALVFLVTVTVMQFAFTAISGQRSAVAVVASTLLIAALFTPLRRRIQHDIDRRFYRRKYDAEQAIERFAAAARSETDIDRLTAELLAVVGETMQPESASLWMLPGRKRKQVNDG
jgi:hypothetical protein